MNLSLFIAKRYLISKKSHNAINVITAISIVGVTVGTTALIVVLSVFNGFENLVMSLYNSFDPDIEITAKYGKTFEPSDYLYQQLTSVEGIKALSPVVEENALLKYNNRQYIATIKGVNSDYLQQTGLDTMLADGKITLQRDCTYFALVGQGVANKLGVNIHDVLSFLQVYVPRRGITFNSLNPESAFTSEAVTAGGIFAIQQDFDSKYVLLPLPFVKKLLNYSSQVSAIEIILKPGTDSKKIQAQIEQISGNKLIVKNRFQQHALLYKIMRSEKWAVFLILGFILIIATFNVIGSLTMLIIEKKKDMIVLRSMGATVSFIRKLFLTEGLMISFIGGISGLLIGTAICLSQLHFGWIKMPGGGSFVVDAYPVRMQISDFVFVFGTVLTIGFLAAFYPSQTLIKKEHIQIK
jgi:lipoprotein-releasing system permease protein